jgi:hypothetical protein
MSCFIKIPYEDRTHKSAFKGYGRHLVYILKFLKKIKKRTIFYFKPLIIIANQEEIKRGKALYAFPLVARRGRISKLFLRDLKRLVDF